MAESSINSRFEGLGIQNATGSVSAGRDININHPGQNDKSAAFLSKLYTTDPRLDKRRIEKVKGGLLDDCCNWILQHDDFTGWRNSSEGQLLWIRGDPGKGKTMLVCGVINQLEKEIQEFEPEASLAYFFFQAADERINTATTALRSLSHTLLKNNERAQKKVVAEFGNRGEDIFTDVNRWFALCEVLDTILDSDPSRQIFLLIDALDECVEQLEDLLELLVELPRDNVKVLVSSRNWPEIDAGLRQCPGQISLRLELNKDAVSQAVLWYINLKVEELAKKKRLDHSSRMKAEKYLRDGADDTFLWVALVCQELRSLKITKWNFLANLETFPSGLESFYCRMADTVASHDSHELLRNILAIVTLAYRPLELGELSSVVENHESFPHDPEFWQETVESCGSFLVVLDNMASFVHQSGQEYTLGLFQAGYFSRTIPQQHGIIAQQALHSISETLRENLYGLESPGCHIQDIKLPDDNPLGPLKYSCMHWAEHVCDAVGDMPNDDRLHLMGEGGQVRTFITLHFLHWLESLSLLEAAPSAIVSLAKLIGVEEQKQPTGQHDTESILLSLLRDGVRFVQYFVECIQSYPIQLYTCAPLFTPSESPIGRLLHRRPPHWMQYLPKPRRDWGRSPRVIETDCSIHALAVSPSGEKLATGGRDGRVSVWDFLTGRRLQEFKVSETSSDVEVITFSRTDDILATGSRGGEVVICSITARESVLLGRTEGKVRRLSLATDGCRLIATSSHIQPAIWSLRTSSEKKPTLADWFIAPTLDEPLVVRSSGHLPSRRNRFLAISPNSLLIALVDAAVDERVEIWNTSTWVCELSLPCPTGLTTVLFSPNSAMVAITSTRSLRIASVVGNPYGDHVVYYFENLRKIADWSHDGRYIALVMLSGLALFSLSERALGSDRVGTNTRRARFLKDGGTIIGVSQSSKAISVWDLDFATQMDTAPSVPFMDSSVVTVAPSCEFVVAKRHDSNWLRLHSVAGDKKWFEFKPADTLDKVFVLRGGASPVIASLDDHGGICVWHMTDSSPPPWRLEAGEELRNLTVSPDLTTVGTIGYDGHILLWNAYRESIEWEFPGELQDVEYAAMAFDSANNIGLLTTRGSAVILSHGEGFRLQDYRDDDDALVAGEAVVSFSPCGSFLATGYQREDEHAILKLWDIKSRKCQVVVSQPLPVIFEWPRTGAVSATGNSWAVFRLNFDNLEIVPLSHPRQAALRHVEGCPDWLCLEEERVLWLPFAWRPADANFPSLTLPGGWAGPFMPLCDRNGHYMDIRLSRDYLTTPS